MNNTTRKKNALGLVRQLKTLEKHHFTGEVKIQSLSGLEWTLYFCVGRLIWVSSNFHTVRRLYRHLHRECPELTLQMMTLRESSGFNYGWDYKVIEVFVLRKRLTKEQAQKVVFNLVSENLFDILQRENKEFLTYRRTPNDLSNSAMGFQSILKIGSLLQGLVYSWTLWTENNIQQIPVYLAPKLKNQDELRQNTSSSAYEKITTLINGTQTFREIALTMDMDILLVMRSLYPLMKKGFVQLTNLEDWSRPEPKSQRKPSVRNKPLVACIDDSPQVCWQMEQILNTNGCEAITIQDPARALSTILENPPQLIFLDVVMPIVNGYELCTQLRRVSALQKTPIIFLSGNVVDRLRAKMVGASGCINKPIDKDKVLCCVKKYLSPVSSTRPARKSKPRTANTAKIQAIPQT